MHANMAVFQMKCSERLRNAERLSPIQVGVTVPNRSEKDSMMHVRLPTSCEAENCDRSAKDRSRNKVWDGTIGNYCYDMQLGVLQYEQEGI